MTVLPLSLIAGETEPWSLAALGTQATDCHELLQPTLLLVPGLFCNDSQADAMCVREPHKRIYRPRARYGGT